MNLELFVFIQLVTGFMGFLLGRAVRNIDRRNKTELPDDSDVRTYVPRRCRDRERNYRLIMQVDAEGREIK